MSVTFAVIVTGPPGSGKTTVVANLSDALVVDEIPHASVDVDEVAWGLSFPDLGQCEHLRAWLDGVHVVAGTERLSPAESRSADGERLARNRHGSLRVAADLCGVG